MSVTEILGTDLDKTIASAVTARVESEVLKALSGDEVFGKLVTAALHQTVTVGDTYNKQKVPFLHAVLNKAIQEATAEAVRQIIAEELPQLTEHVRKALRRNLGTIADQLTDALTKAAEKTYGVNVTVDLRMPNA